MNFAGDLYKRDLSFDETEKEQEELLKKINGLKKRIKPATGPGPKKSNKGKMENLEKNATDLYNFKNRIIDIIKKEAGDSSESDEETEDKSLDLSWLKYPDYFEKLIKDYEEDPNLSHSFDNNKKNNRPKQCRTVYKRHIAC